LFLTHWGVYQPSLHRDFPLAFNLKSGDLVLLLELRLSHQRLGFPKYSLHHSSYDLARQPSFLDKSVSSIFIFSILDISCRLFTKDELIQNKVNSNTTSQTLLSARTTSHMPTTEFPPAHPKPKELSNLVHKIDHHNLPSQHNKSLTTDNFSTCSRKTSTVFAGKMLQRNMSLISTSTPESVTERRYHQHQHLQYNAPHNCATIIDLTKL
jgi:hypothetical protein